MVEVSLLVTLPLKLVPSFNVTVADGPAAAGGALLLQPASMTDRVTNAISTRDEIVFMRLLFLYPKLTTSGGLRKHPAITGYAAQHRSEPVRVQSLKHF